MSRRLILGLQQTFCRSFAPSQPGSLVPQLPVSAACPLRPCFERSSARLLATAAAQTQLAQVATSVKLPDSSAQQTDNAFPLLQQSSVPPDQYTFLARTTGSYSANRKPVFAVVEIGPTQFKVAPDDLVYSEKLKGVDVGDKVSLNKVLLLGNRCTTMIGRPLVPDATVTAVVEVSKSFRVLTLHLQLLVCTSILIGQHTCCRSNS